MPLAINFFVHYAYAILFLWVLIEQLGVPVPTAPLMITTGTLIGTHQLHTLPALACILSACFITDTLWYLAGVKYGGKVVRLVCRLTMEATTCVRRTEDYFTRRGAMALLFAKFVPGISALAPPVAGQTGMPYARFLLFDLTGALLWSSAYIFGGRFIGALAERFRPLLGFLLHFGVLLFALLVVGLVLRRVWKQRVFLRDLRAARIAPDELNRLVHLAEEQGLTPPFIVDLRHPLDYKPDPRVLPGALRISPVELEKHSDLLPRDRDVILYCTCPSEETSASLAKKLQKLGVQRVRPLQGGFDGWRSAGYPLCEYDESSVLEDLPALAAVPTR